MIAFQKFKEINALSDVITKHRAWLKDYEEFVYSIAEDGKHKIKWATEKKHYHDNHFSTTINCIGRLPNRTIIEFDNKKEDKMPDREKTKEDIEKIKQTFKEYGWGYIESTHQGNSNYIWVEFNRTMKDKEITSFLEYLCPKGSEIDLNFASSKKVFPVLFAPHWKHSTQREQVINYVEGNQVDFDALGISDKSKIEELRTSFTYKTFLNAGKIYGRKGQAETFSSIQPMFYDKNKLWWLWNDELKCWEITDEVDILNMIEKATGMDIISSTSRTEIINSMKQEGRKKIPKQIKPTWIQFKNEIFDIKTGETFDATPEYFVTNPISFELHKEKFMETPVMDKIFTEWVGKDYIKTLYEIIAYCCLSDYPIHRLFCFIGAGMNGKSCFLRLLKKFIGENNCCSTELDTLLTSRFEVTRLYKKLVCQMGETNFNELSKTSIIKKLTGQDLIGFEYKGKNPFESSNYAKIIISTNNLPATTDKTVGFYRRWLIIDFPNQFSEEKEVLADIPEEEYSCLALKVAFLLKDLLSDRKFHNEGSIQERMEKYEAKSNFLDRFMKEFCDRSDLNAYITKNDFYKKFVAWSKENRHREMSEHSLGVMIKKTGIEEGRKDFSWMNDGRGGQARVWYGITWK